MLGDSINVEGSHSLRCQMMNAGVLKSLRLASTEIPCQQLSDELKSESELDRKSPNPKLNDSYFPKSLIS